ncbi:MAG TPA: Pvc16 family protein, partial [Burkholderiales bacterium]|nr:Pvc16 family protein [Burkholderiales bacterium]
MALSDSLEAIGAVSELLQTRLQAATKVSVDVGRPESAAAGSGRKLNLFLYRLGHDGSLRNVSLDRGQEPPLWLTLHYLLTAFEDK